MHTVFMDNAVSVQNIAVIIVNYGNYSDTLACLFALSRLEGSPRRIIVVDNNSPNDSVRRIVEGWSAFSAPVVLCEKGAGCPGLPDAARHVLPDGGQHVVLPLTVNRGFAAGNNAAIRLALQDRECRAVWLLNNDTEPQPGALNALYSRLCHHPRVGIAGSSLVYAHDRSTVQTLAGEWFVPLLGQTGYIGAGISLGAARRLHAQPDVEKQLASITGASMLIRREIIEQVGMLDENFFCYVEEIEYCIRARKAGFTLAWAPDSIVYHIEGGSTGARSAFCPSISSPLATAPAPMSSADRAASVTPLRPEWVDYLMLRNRIYMMCRHYPWALPVVLVSYLGVMLNRIRRGQARRIGLVCRSAWDGFCGHMGGPPKKWGGPHIHT